MYYVTVWSFVVAALLRGLGPTYSLTTVGWCWVDMSRTDAWLWMLLTGKAWEIVAYGLQIVLCIRIRREIKKKVKDTPCCSWLFRNHILKNNVNTTICLYALKK